MAITTIDGLVAAFASSDLYSIMKFGPGGIDGGFLHSQWLAGYSPVAGAIPTTAATCNSSLAGSIPFTNPVSPALSYLGYFSLHNPFGLSQPLMGFLKDRLAHMGGLSGTNTGVQTVGLSVPSGRLASVSLDNVEWYVEGFVALGTTPQTLTVTYVPTTGGSNTVAIPIVASFPKARLYRIIPSTAGDVIQSITSCQLSGSTGATGNFGFVCARNLAQYGSSSSWLPDTADPAILGLPEIPDNACLWLSVVIVTQGGWSGNGCYGLLKIIQG